MEAVLMENGTTKQSDEDINYPVSSTETIDNSCETSSWSSETPLLTDGKDCIDEPIAEQKQHVDNQTTCLSYTNSVSDVNSYDISVTSPDVALREDYKYPAKTESLDIHSAQQLSSNISLAMSEIEEVVPTVRNSLHVFGSGWEFGSVCSIPYRSNHDIRSSTTTIDKQPHDLQGRLLSRIFKEKIAGTDVIKSSSKDLSAGFMAPLEETSENIPSQNNQKNLLVLSCGVMLLHIAIFGLRNLQSSINSKQGLGVLSLAILFASFMVCSLISPFIVQRFRPKFCLSVACVGHVFYVVANYYPTFYTIIPTAFLHGGSSALLWNAMSTYVTEIGHAEAEKRSKSVTNVLSRYFGVLFLTLQLAMVFGNLVSSVILSQSMKRDNVSTIVVSNSSNEDIYGSTSNTTMSIPYCGVQKCEMSEKSDTNPPVDDLDKVFLLGTYLSCAILSVLVIQCCLDPLPTYIPTTASLGEIVRQAGAVLTMVVDSRFCFLVIMCLYTVVGNGFVVADVLKVFITCPLGMKMVGYSMICFGICGSVSSYIFGKLAKWIGSITAFLIAGSMNVTCLTLMTQWEPTSDDIYFLFAFIGAWGFADGIWQSQTNSLISSAFADRYETAFGCCRILQGLAGILVFGMSNFLCMTSKIIVTTATCLLAVISYIAMEVLHRRQTDVTDELSIDVL